MKKKSFLSVVLMLMTFGLAMISCSKDEDLTTLSPVNPNINSDVPEGAINALFSVSEQRKVYFSKGNLQYKASTNTWRFAENQYDFIGNDNSNISSTFTGWIDLFGWGTSGYNHGAICYQPWSTNENYENYYAYGSPTKNLFDDSGKADWGYNAISNGGNKTNIWRTLTNNEWDYLLYYRNTSSNIRYVCAHIDNGIIYDTIVGVNGVLLFPDNWDESIMMNINEPYNYYNNRISMGDWVVLETKGVVFIPAAGRRGYHEVKTLDNKAIFNDNDVHAVNRGGSYWTATSGYSYTGMNAYSLFLANMFCISNTNAFKDYGYSVRLVQDIEK